MEGSGARGGPGRRLIAESLAIVISILLAFWIDAAWDAREDRLERVQILQGLEVEYIDLAARLRATAERYDRFAGEVAWLLNDAPRTSPLDVPRLDEVLLATLWVGTFEPGSGVRSAVLSSGRLELIESGELEQLLAGWDARVAESTDDEIGMRDFVFQQLAPLVASRGFELGRFTERLRGELVLRSDQAAEADYETLLNDPEFRSLAQYRFNWILISRAGFAELAEEADSILILIRDELAGS